MRYPWASQVMLVVKNTPANAGGSRDVGSIPGWGRSPGRGHSNPLQYSCLENPVDRGAWWPTVHGVPKSWTWLKWLSSMQLYVDCFHTDFWPQKTNEIMWIKRWAILGSEQYIHLSWWPQTWPIQAALILKQRDCLSTKLTPVTGWCGGPAEPLHPWQSPREPPQWASFQELICRPQGGAWPRGFFEAKAMTIPSLLLSWWCTRPAQSPTKPLSDPEKIHTNGSGHRV